MNTQIFNQLTYEAEPVSSTLLGCVYSEGPDYTEHLVWKDEVIVEIFSTLIANRPKLVTDERYFTLMHFDTVGHPVTVEEWTFDCIGTNSPILKSVTLSDGKRFHCIKAEPFNQYQLGISLSRIHV